MNLDFTKIIASPLLNNLSEVENARLQRMKEELDRLLEKSVDVSFKKGTLKHQEYLTEALEYMSFAQETARGVSDRLSTLARAKKEKDRLNLVNSQDSSRELLKSLNNKIAPYNDKEDIMIEYVQRFLESVSTISDMKIKFRSLKFAFKNHVEIKQRLESYNFQTYEKALEFIL